MWGIAQVSTGDQTLSEGPSRSYELGYSSSKGTDMCGILREVKESYTKLWKGLCTERGKGGLLILTGGSLGSYRIYILRLTVLGTVVRLQGD